MNSRLILSRPRLGELMSRLRADGYEVVGPTLRNGAIVLDVIESDCELPLGLRDRQEPAKYRVERRDDEAVFGFAVGPHSFKKFFLVAEERLFQVRREGKRLAFVPEPTRARRLALFGARGCDLAALRIQDRVLEGDRFRDERYIARRSDVFVVAVHCGTASASCFCTSMHTGPRAAGPWDLALTELWSGEHRFLVEVGSNTGARMVAPLELEPASESDLVEAENVLRRTSESIARRLDTRGLPERLRENPEHPRLREVSERCLACTNCTMVCPTCFCTSIEDISDFTGTLAERRRRWDSCFTSDFSYIHGGSVRPNTRSRYRQWLTHKLSTWVDQFQSSGCVGCGRCITWCPVGIDISEEAAAIGARTKE